MNADTLPVTPTLQKSRMRHTRFLIVALIPLLALSHGLIADGSSLHESLELLGYFFIILCVLGRAYCSIFIGGRKNDEIVDSGPYSIVRNPLYVFSFLGVAGIGMQTGMLLFATGLPLIFALYYPRVIRREEAYLEHKFGARYAEYKARVPRIIPNLSLWREPEEVTMRPRFVRETMLDASLFFAVLPILEILEMLHHQGIVPAYLMLP